MLSGWVASWLAQLLFTYTVGWFISSKTRLQFWNGYLFRLCAAAPVARFVPGISIKKTVNSWQPTEEYVNGKKAVMIIANHRSFMDPFALGSAMLPLETKYVAKSELFKVPFGGWAMKRGGDLAVRFDKNKNQGWGTVKGSTGQLLLQAAEHLQNGNSIAIFPEGTRMGFDATRAAEAAAHESKLMPFKPPFFDLAKKLNISVVCVAMRGTDDVWPVGSNMQRPASVLIDIAEPISPTQFNSDVEFADAMRIKLGKMYQDLCSAS